MSVSSARLECGEHYSVYQTGVLGQLNELGLGEVQQAVLAL